MDGTVEGYWHEDAVGHWNRVEGRRLCGENQCSRQMEKGELRTPGIQAKVEEFEVRQLVRVV
jgi:hypothetical protein